MPNYILITCGHNEPIQAETKAEAIKAGKEYAERYNIHSYVIMNSSADIIFSAEQDPPKQ